MSDLKPDIEKLELPDEIKEAMEQNRLILESNLQLIKAWLCPRYVYHGDNIELGGHDE